MGTALYRLLLRALPAGLRQDCGHDMEELFGQYRREVAGHPWRASLLWMSAVRDIAVQSAAERSAIRAANRVPFSLRITYAH